MANLHLILICVIVAKFAESANILMVIPFTSKSHYIMLSPIGLELAKRGHNVTVITALQERNPPPNYHQVLVENKEIWDVLGTKRPVIFDMTQKSFEEFLNEVLWRGGLGFVEVALKSPHLQEFLKKNNTFDLVISEQFYQESLNILAYKYKAPLVLISTLGNCMKHNFVVGNPLQLNTVIFEALPLKDHTSIWGRLRNIYITVYEYVWWKYWYLGKQEALMRKYIPDLEEPVPSLFEMQKNVSLLLINTHFSFDPPMALLPNIVEIGGMHLTKSNSSLPKDLQAILDNAMDGFVYMNFGSNVVISEMEEKKLMALFNVFRKLKQTVLMKWEKDTLPNKPQNIVMRKWFPQKEIFAHPNIRVFISHGGLIGTQEATFNGVPILGVPIYADQYNNLDLAKKNGFGKILEYEDINEDNLEEALSEMLNYKSYKLNAEEMAKRFQDRPMTPLETTLWWLEYVIRHKGATFLKSAAGNMSWFKYFMLDVYLVVITTIATLICLILFVVKIIRKLLGINIKINLKKKQSAWIFLIFLLSLTISCEAYNILYIVPFTSKSHYIMLRPLGLELARKGHNVTVITANKEASPPRNYREVMVVNKEIWEVIGGERPNVFTMVDKSAEEFHDIIFWRAGSAFTEVALNSSDVQNFLKEDNSFDLVIAEQFFQEALYVLSYKYKAPLALVTTFGNCMRHNILTGNPLQLNTVVSEFLEIRDMSSFWGRLRNMYFAAYEYLWWKYWYMAKQEQLVEKYMTDLPKPVPSLYEIQQNTSLFLMNSHFSFDTPAAYLPNLVEIGGLHLSKSESKLPEDLQKILDSATDGVIYMNLGSNVRSAELPDEKKRAFLNVFRKLKQIVIWKWEDDKLEGRPANLVTRKWLPQKDILAHPNVRVFISHGGLIGTQEAIFNGVPIVGIPIYADQYNNLLLAQQTGFGTVLLYHSINENTVENALLDVLYNESYRIKAKELSTRWKDRPMNPLDSAVFWIEYVIRNNGADFIKNPARNLSWIAYSMLDLYVFVAAVFLSCVCLVYIIIKFLVHVPKHYKIEFIRYKEKKT
ncbi:uncharacterized protein [Epargyreus clarus]|uniref:uncharacterized protein n=1 Tax=Epargyreus clarus TaxID=520877 RepID=UPI003C3012D8